MKMKAAKYLIFTIYKLTKSHIRLRQVPFCFLLEDKGHCCFLQYTECLTKKVQGFVDIPLMNWSVSVVSEAYNLMDKSDKSPIYNIKGRDHI